jgi:hypothetical protein
MNRPTLARALSQALSIAGLVDTLGLRVWNTDLIHAAFSALHDPGFTASTLILAPALVRLLVLTTPSAFAARRRPRHRAAIVLGGLLCAGAVFWYAGTDTLYRFCDRPPAPEDVADPSLRNRLLQHQSNFWSAFVFDSEEDMWAAKADYLQALAVAQVEHCENLSYFRAAASDRAQWAAIIQLAFACLTGWLFVMLALHAIGRSGFPNAFPNAFRDALVVALAFYALGTALNAYSEWYLRFTAIDLVPVWPLYFGITAAIGALFGVWRRRAAFVPLLGLASAFAVVALLVDGLALIAPGYFAALAHGFATSGLGLIVTGYLIVGIAVYSVVGQYARKLEA